MVSHLDYTGLTLFSRQPTFCSVHPWASSWARNGFQSHKLVRSPWPVPSCQNLRQLTFPKWCAQMNLLDTFPFCWELCEAGRRFQHTRHKTQDWSAVVILKTSAGRKGSLPLASVKTALPSEQAHSFSSQGTFSPLLLVLQHCIIYMTFSRDPPNTDWASC